MAATVTRSSAAQRAGTAAAVVVAVVGAMLALLAPSSVGAAGDEPVGAGAVGAGPAAKPAEVSAAVRDVAVLRLPVDPGDWRLRHKTTDREFYDAGLRAARNAGADEALFLRDDGLVTEGCITSLFVERGVQLLTPPAQLGLLPGVLRRSLLDAGRAVEAELTLEDLKDGFLIGNALRGLMPARLLP